MPVAGHALVSPGMTAAVLIMMQHATSTNAACMTRAGGMFPASALCAIQQQRQARLRQRRHRTQLVVQLASLKVHAAVQGVAHDAACGVEHMAEGAGQVGAGWRR